MADHYNTRAQIVVLLAVAALIHTSFAFSTTTLKRSFRRTSLDNLQWSPSFRHQHLTWPLFADISGGASTAIQAGSGEDNEQGQEMEDESMMPSDPASTRSQFLAGLWQLIAQGNSLVRGESKTILFPNMGEQLVSRRYLNLVTAHLDSCKDVCDYFGITTTLQPYINEGRVKGFTVKSFRKPDHDPEKMEFAYDPFWDDGDDWDYQGIDDEYEKEDAEGEGKIKSTIKYPDIVNKIPDNDDEILRISKTWVAKICSDMGICPFTSGAEMAGLPIGPVFYTIDRSTSMEDMYARYWQEVVRVEQRSERDLSTTLLIAPEFCIDNIEIFESFATTLTQPLSALGVEDSIQLVFFHPHWSFRDGGERGGEGAAANYARRSPWPMINILRTNQVRAAQKGIPTGLVYKQNEKTLSGVGVEKLETMLRLRDWGEIADVKVDRREMEALRVAQDFQQTGVIKQEDISFAADATPAANKVDGEQIEQGNLVNVVREALEKRLGKQDGTVTRLSGPETSATIMASDFLLAELEKIIASDPVVP
ncbi:DUF1415 domain containing protein [Nitzschia inconspicua]|uniref:DUF1415 domain containing protein n=1 Tax=Nitzschia inconspicua TaxID=303405 RepID=A0A9K3KPZ9_9STRA|nr:DUF1415 domain containing protein [Nitzschia inconspicua]